MTPLPKLTLDPSLLVSVPTRLLKRCCVHFMLLFAFYLSYWSLSDAFMSVNPFATH